MMIKNLYDSKCFDLSSNKFSASVIIILTLLRTLEVTTVYVNRKTKLRLVEG